MVEVLVVLAMAAAELEVVALIATAATTRAEVDCALVVEEMAVAKLEPADVTALSWCHHE